MESINNLIASPFPTILGFGGVLFLLLAFIGKIGGKLIVEITPKRQKKCLLTGIICLVGATVLYSLPFTLTRQTDPPISAEQTNILSESKIETSIESPKEMPIPVQTLNNPLNAFPIYMGLELTEGYDMGVNTSEGKTDWVTDMNGYFAMDYPAGQAYGFVFITFGTPVLTQRPGRDFSNYKYLSLELKGKLGGEVIWIGVKDNTDPDNGKETKKFIDNITTTWQTYTIPLSYFETADLTSLYVVIEFVFESGITAETVLFRNVQYLP